MADVVAVHSAREADSRHALIGRLQGSFQGRPDSGDGQDPPTARDNDSVLQGGASVENLQPCVLDLGQACGSTGFIPDVVDLKRCDTNTDDQAE